MDLHGEERTAVAPHHYFPSKKDGRDGGYVQVGWAGLVGVG